VIEPLAKIAITGADDDWLRRAVETARPELIAPILLVVLRSTSSEPAGDGPLDALAGELATIVGARAEPADVRGVLSACAVPDSDQATREAALIGLAEGLASKGGIVAFVATLADRGQLEPQLDSAFAQAAAAADDESLNEGRRLRKLALLTHARDERSAEACLKLLDSSSAEALRVAAAAALATKSGEKISGPLLAGYSAQLPAVRRAIVDALCVDPGAARQLLEAIRSGQIARAELDTGRENRLRQHRDAGVRELAAIVLKQAVPAERQRVLAEYQASLELAANFDQGKQLFRQHCAVCHKLDDVGVDVAPDISDSRVKTPAQLLTDILNPNQAIDNNYVSYTIATRDGNVHTGIIAAETAGSITLKQQEAKTVSLLRSDVEAIGTSGVSLMPEGFERHLSRQQMADLIGYIKNWRYPAGQAPGKIRSEENAPNR
jgi:putative heme-binding domain-containing protein